MKQAKFRLPIVLVSVPVAVVLGLWLISEWAWGGYVKPLLDPQYIPTAEYLLKHPEPIPAFISIDPPPGSSLEVGKPIRAGLKTKPPKLSGDERDFSEWSYIFINNQRISRSDYYVYYMGGLSSEVPGYEFETMWFSFEPELLPGVHLIRFQLGTSINVLLNPDSAVYTYTWAYRVK